MTQAIEADRGKDTTGAGVAHTLLCSSHNLGTLFLNHLLAQEKKVLAPSLLQQLVFMKKALFNFFCVVNQVLPYSMGSEF